METKHVLKALAALAHESRLMVFRTLVQVGPAGVAAGKLAEMLGMPPSSLSFHLKELVQAELLESRQEGRFIIYVAKYDSMIGLIGFLTENCCGGNPCLPIAADCCPPRSAAS
jgi:ArsR family transcriptional regulator